MKPYLLFRGQSFYPIGGWEDFAGDFDSFDDAMAAYEANRPPEGSYDRRNEWAQIVDTRLVEDDAHYFTEGKLGKIVWEEDANRLKARREEDYE